MSKLKNIINNPRFKHGTMATIITLTVIAIVALIYAISLMLNNKYSLSLDMTSKKIFELTDESKNYVSNLNSDVTIRVLSPEKDFINNQYYPEQYHQLNQILKMYKKYGKNIKLIYDDIIKNPNLVNKYKDEQVNQYSIIVEMQGRHRVLNGDNLFEAEQSYMSQKIVASKAEQAITSAIMAMNADKQYKIGILSGHEEIEIAGFEKLLTDNLYEVSKINMLTSNIPQDLSLVVIAAPQKDYSEAEIDKLNKFLENNGEYGKNVLYFSGIYENELPNIASFLKNWDINIDKAVAYDEKNMTQLSQYSAIVEYSEQDLFRTLIEKNAYTVFLLSRPVTFLEADAKEKTHTNLLSFSGNAVGLKYSNDSIETPEQATIKGPFAAVAKSSKINNSKISSVIVSGSVMSIKDEFLFQSALANADVYLKIVGDATNKKDMGVNIVAKKFGGAEMNIKQNTVNMLRLIFVVFVPAIVVGCGLSVWMGRRYK